MRLLNKPKSNDCTDDGIPKQYHCECGAYFTVKVESISDTGCADTKRMV